MLDDDHVAREFLNGKSTIPKVVCLPFNHRNRQLWLDQDLSYQGRKAQALSPVANEFLDAWWIGKIGDEEATTCQQYGYDKRISDKLLLQHRV